MTGQNPPVAAGNARSFAGEMQPKIGWGSKLVLQVVIKTVTFRDTRHGGKIPSPKGVIVLI